MTSSHDPLDEANLRSALEQLEGLAAAIEQAELECSDELASVADEMRPGARNLVHYVALRRFDVRGLQKQLQDMGLSSLGRSEARVRATLTDVQRVIRRLLGGASEFVPRDAADPQLLRRHCRALLGTEERGSIMVTLPSEAAADGQLVRELLREGMNLARINCAHDGEQAWVAMAEHVRAASAELDRPCRILFDLPGPKLRTLEIAAPGYIELHVGDLLLLTGDGAEGSPARFDEAGRLLEPGRVACAVPEVARALAVGAPVFFDDGKLAGTVEAVREGRAHIRITSLHKATVKLRAGRGINVPETELAVPALGPDDLAALTIATRHADLVGLSFCRTREDVESLQRELARLGSALGVVLKIETRQGFMHLPSLLLTALKRPPVGVMIARGDLAVECGFERMAELQEEILWLCEAAHVPCIWATQVLETLAKKGRVTRAEITDAAMAERAECVMLNKGPHIVRALRTLRDVMGRMRGHQHKKSALLRPLRSPRFEPSDEGAATSS